MTARQSRASPGARTRLGLLGALLLYGALAPSAGGAQQIEVTGSRFEITDASGRMLEQRELIGVTLTVADGAGNALPLRIDGVEPDPLDPSGELLLYTFLIPEGDNGGWKNLCEPGPDGLARGFPLTGVPSDGESQVSSGDFSLVCTSGAQGKCVRLGYKPWTMARDGRPMSQYHEACVRMLRADYCGDGTPHTRNGTLINLYDKLGIQKPDKEPSDFEAAWGPAGAVCVRKPRIPELLDLDELLEECPDRLGGHLGDACSEDGALGDPRALILNRS